jgi:hypothetical protein
MSKNFFRLASARHEGQKKGKGKEGGGEGSGGERREGKGGGGKGRDGNGGKSASWFLGGWTPLYDVARKDISDATLT